MKRRVKTWALWIGLLLSGCGGGGGGDSVTSTEPPASSAGVMVQAQPITGTWAENDLTPSTLLIGTDGLAYGLLSGSNQRIEIVRGQMTGANGQVAPGNWTSASLNPNFSNRSIPYRGTFQARSSLNLVADDGSPLMTAVYDTGHDPVVPPALIAGVYSASVSFGGFGADFSLEAKRDGTVRLIHNVKKLCQFQGTLRARSETPAHYDLTLSYSGASGCGVEKVTDFKGLALVDPVTRQISGFAMTEDGSMGLLLYAERN